MSKAEAPSHELPSPALFAEVVGQPRAVEALRAAARNPVHAYLFLGPRGTTRRAAARGFAAALLCPQGGCGVCTSCRLALAGKHPDLVTVERSGAALGVEDARRLVALAQRRPYQSARQVLVVPDVHLAVRSAPALLKTIEEPPETTFFVLLADELPPELATVFSRCVEVPFRAVTSDELEQWLRQRGSDPELARQVARWSGGDVERASLLVDDPGAVARATLWQSIPDRLDGSGSAAAEAAVEIRAAIDAAVQALRDRHAAELQQLTEQAEQWGERGLPGRREIVDRHHREERRWRTEEIEAGLASLARSYRDAMASELEREAASASVSAPAVSGPSTGSRSWSAAHSGVARAADAAMLVSKAAEALTWNPNELLLLEALFVQLSDL